MSIHWRVSEREHPQKCHFLYFLERPLQQFCTTVQTVIHFTISEKVRKPLYKCTGTNMIFCTQVKILLFSHHGQYGAPLYAWARKFLSSLTAWKWSMIWPKHYLHELNLDTLLALLPIQWSNPHLSCTIHYQLYLALEVKFPSCSSKLHIDSLPFCSG